MTARRAPVILLQAANLLSGVANSSVAVLVPWLVLQETGSAADAGLVAAAAGIPGIFVSPFVGALVDRWAGGGCRWAPMRSACRGRLPSLPPASASGVDARR